MEKEPEEIIICGKDWYRKTLLIGAIAIIAITAILVATGYFLDSRKQEKTTVIPEPEVKVIKEVEVVEVVKEVEVDPYSWGEFTITGYTANDKSQGTNNIVATGFNLDYENVENLPIVATDPEVIPLYSVIEIKDLGPFLALDTGGAIKGNRIDILFEDIVEARKWGVQQRMVRVIE